MNTREYVNSLFTDESIMQARTHDVNLADLALTTAIIPISITIELPAFIMASLEDYKEASGVRIEDLVEELILNKILNDSSLINQMLSIWNHKKNC